MDQRDLEASTIGWIHSMLESRIITTQQATVMFDRRSINNLPRMNIQGCADKAKYLEVLFEWKLN